MSSTTQYELIQKLATGGMAEVFLAKVAGPGGFEKRVVLKRILPHLAEDPRFVELFVKEARLAALLDHPNIVHVFDVGVHDGRYFLAMEHIDGIDLRTLMFRAKTRGDSLSPVACARLVSLAAQGLAHAHDFRHPETGEPLSIVHRDATPDNVLLSRNGTVKVVDFGIAKAAGEKQTKTSGIRGKLAYMAPEQVRGRALDRRTDVYTLGAVLYELLSFARPFELAHEAMLMQAIVHEPHVPLLERRADLPAPLVSAVERALSKSPEHRFQSCRELHEALEAFILESGQAASSHHLAQLVARYDERVPSSARSEITRIAPVDPPDTVVEHLEPPRAKVAAASAAALARGGRAGPPAPANGGRAATAGGASPAGARRGAGPLAPAAHTGGGARAVGGSTAPVAHGVSGTGLGGGGLGSGRASAVSLGGAASAALRLSVELPAPDGTSEITIRAVPSEEATVVAKDVRTLPQASMPVTLSETNGRTARQRKSRRLALLVIGMAVAASVLAIWLDAAAMPQWLFDATATPPPPQVAPPTPPPAP